jgi:pimeloyl-ACP methyl ester carboxylesterase
MTGARRRRSRWPSRAEARAHLGARSFFARADPRAIDLYVQDGLRLLDDGSVELACTGATEAAIFGHAGSVDVGTLARGLVPSTLFLWAEDGDFPRPLYEALAASMRDGRVEAVPTTHLVPLERPDLVADAALRLLGRR